MSGFGIPSVIPPVSITPETVIGNDGWFPDIDPAKFRLQMRIRDSVTPERLREAVLAAMIDIGNNLTAWRARHEATLILRLEDVPSPKLGDESRLVILYRRAVGASAKADLVERYRDVDLTGQGDRQVADLDNSVSELRRDAIHAVRDMRGATRMNVELI